MQGKCLIQSVEKMKSEADAVNKADQKAVCAGSDTILQKVPLMKLEGGQKLF